MATAATAVVARAGFRQREAIAAALLDRGIASRPAGRRWSAAQTSVTAGEATEVIP